MPATNLKPEGEDVEEEGNPLSLSLSIALSHALLTSTFLGQGILITLGGAERQCAAGHESSATFTVKSRKGGCCEARVSHSTPLGRAQRPPAHSSSFSSTSLLSCLELSDTKV